MKNVCRKQKATTLEEPKDKPKAKKAAKSKYEELPEIPDYERPELEKYEESDFDPSKKEKVQVTKTPNQRQINLIKKQDSKVSTAN